MQGNSEVRERLNTTHRMADSIISVFAELRQESDQHWERISISVSVIGQIICSTDYSRTLPEDWRETVMAFSKIRVQRGFAYLGDLAIRTPLKSLTNYRDWRAQVKIMYDAIEQEKAFTEQCEMWIERQKQWRYERG